MPINKLRGDRAIISAEAILKNGKKRYDFGGIRLAISC
jgi:hypothetical protein